MLLRLRKSVPPNSEGGLKRDREYTDSSIDNSVYALDDKDDRCSKFSCVSKIRSIGSPYPRLCTLYVPPHRLCTEKNQLFTFTVDILPDAPDWAASNISTQHRAKEKQHSSEVPKLSFTKSNGFNIYLCPTTSCKILVFYTR